MQSLFKNTLIISSNKKKVDVVGIRKNFICDFPSVYFDLFTIYCLVCINFFRYLNQTIHIHKFWTRNPNVSSSFFKEQNQHIILGLRTFLRVKYHQIWHFNLQFFMINTRQRIRLCWLKLHYKHKYLYYYSKLNSH